MDPLDPATVVQPFVTKSHAPTSKVQRSNEEHQELHFPESGQTCHMPGYM